MQSPASQLAGCRPDRRARFPDYAREVVPILEANCIRCHSPAQQEGGLLLDSYEDLITGGDSGAAITPGNAAASRLVAMIRRAREEEDAAQERFASGRNCDAPRVD